MPDQLGLFSARSAPPRDTVPSAAAVIASGFTPLQWFERRYLVVVHEHCERPLGDAACDHYEGSPIRDGYAGVMVLIDAWTDEPGCFELRCLE